MLSPSMLQLPHLPEGHFVWLWTPAWGALLWWLWSRVSRRQTLLWAAFAGTLHLTPASAQVLGATAAITEMAGDVPPAFWVLQGLNVAAFGMILGTLYAVLRRVAHARQMQAVLAERRRIADDLHDGVGSRLVALLASQSPKSTGSDELSMALQACLLELHMTVDDLDDQRSATAVERLAHLRYRLQPAFDRLGVRLVWHISAAAQACPLAPETSMQICRVAQEALSNALRHSHASRVELRFGPQPGRTHGLVLEVRDDGCGIVAPGAGPSDALGKGLRSMRTRANAVHGELAITNGVPHGLCVRLLIPCEEAAAGSMPTPIASMP
jgi:signal transduction histidine kinase